MIKSLAMLLALILALGGTVVGTTGCDALGIGKDSSKDDDGKKKKKKDDDEEEEEEEEEKEAKKDDKEEETTPASNGNVKDCPGQTKLSGTRRVLRPLSVYESTDTSSTRITGLAPGTLVNLKFQCGNWIMVDYPSGVGQMSPGWVNVAVRSTEWKVESDDDDDKKEEEKKEEKEEEKEEKEEEKKEDPPDAGTQDPPDAGPTKIRIPKLIKKN